MKDKMEQSPAINPNPVLSVEKDGIVLYSNEAGEPLLHEWGVRVGEKLPSSIGDIVRRVISWNSPEKMEVKVGKSVYLVVFHPLSIQECVNISGFDISDQKELEEKPLESEEKYQKLFNLIEQAVQIGEIVFDEKGQPIDNIILDVNLAYEKHSGLRREQVIGRGFKEILPIVEQTWLDRCGEVVRTGMGMHFEEYNASLDKWFEVFASPMGGNRFIAVFSDINERKQAGEALLKSEQHYRLLHETMLQGVVYQDASGKIISMNPAAERILGKTPAEFLGSSSVGEEHLTIREDGSPFPGLEHPSMVSLRTGRKVQDVVMGVYNPRENCYRWININAVPIFRTGEDKPFQVYTLFDDITECKQEEHRMLRYNRILEGINKIFSNVVQAKTEEELGNACLSVALEITGSQFGFINEMGADGLLHDVAKSELGWEQCFMYDKTGHRRPPSDFVVHGLYGSVIINEKSLFTNDPQSHPDSIGLPEGHPPLTSFLGVPLVQNGKTVGLIAVANREKGYSCEQQEDLEAIVPAVVHALQRKKAEQKRKQAEKALQMSEERYRSLYENSLDGILLTKPDGTILCANPQACQMFGMTEDEIKRVGRKGILINDKKLAAALEERELTGRMRAELIHRRKDGSTFVCDTTSKLFVDADGSISTSLIIRDISERKRAERALRESEEKYRIVADNTFDWEFWLDPDGCFLYTSPSCERVTGYAAWEFIDNPDLLQEIIHPDDLQAFLQHQHDMPQGLHGDIEFRIVTKDGEIRWIHHLCQPLYDGEGGYAGSRGSNRDITERKQAEETLAFERSQLLSIFDGIDDVVYVTDPYTYEVLYANKAMKERFGGELVGGICYREFQQRDSPCDFCTNPIILKEKDKPYHWEYYNPSVDRYFMVMDRIIKWPDGRDVRFEIAKDITERRRAEEALSQERNLLESVMRTTDVMLVFLDPQFNFVWVNPAYAEACRMKPEDMVGKNHFALYPHAENEAIFRKVRDTGEGVFYKDKPFVYPDQPERGVTYWDWSLTSVKDSCGEVEGLVFSLRETTKYKQVEEALRESEERLRLLGDNLPDSAIYQFVHEPDGSVRFLYFSTGIERLNGVNVRDVLRDPNTLYRQVPPDYLERVFEAEARSARELSDFDMELPMRLPDGQMKWMRLHSRPRRLPDGRTLWNGVQIDITENKQAEEALKKAHENLEEKVKERTAELEEAYNSLKESERGLAEAQRMAHIGNWDNDLVIGELHWSEEMYHIFGRNPQEGINYEKFLSHVHPEDRDYVYNSTKEAFSGKVYATDYRIVRPDGEERIVHSEREVIFDERNNPVRMRGTLQDITERKMAEEALERMDKVRIKEIHHRIKNNLQIISSLLDLQAEKFEDENVIEAFREGQNRVISMSLIHEELYKGEGTDTLDFSAYLKKLAENLFKTYNLSSKNISLSMDLEENTFLDMDTAVPLGIIVNELVSNSLKHAFTEKEEGKIRIKFSREERNCDTHNFLFSLTISDDGKGLPEDLELGCAESLGLQLVNILVDQLGGELELKRAQGTEFTIKFKVVEKDNQASAPAT